MKLKKKVLATSVAPRAKRGMACPGCGKKGSVIAICIFTVKAPLAKGGGIKMAGIPVNHNKVKEAWEADKNKFCVCESCKLSLKYVKGTGLVRL